MLLHPYCSEVNFNAEAVPDEMMNELNKFILDSFCNLSPMWSAQRH